MTNDELPLSGSTSIQNTMTVGSVDRGLVVGTNTGVINKNYIGGDTYNHIQFFVLNAQGRNVGLKNLISRATEPYKFLSPYGPQDAPIFKGRENEVSQLVQDIRKRRLVVINGEASVGKTSLLAAGVIPQLLDQGVMTMKIQEYANPVETISQALKLEHQDLRVDLPEPLTFSGVIHAITTALNGTLVLVLDQFELLFENSITDERDRFIHELATCLREIPAELLRVVIAVRDEAKIRVWELQDRIPELFQCQIHLLPLDQTQAAVAIREPLKVVESRVAFHDDVVERLLVPDLAALGSANPNHVHPPYLQIVSSWLYRTSTKTNPPRIIDEAMLEQANGAEGIFASYLQKTLKTIEGEGRLWSRMLALMTRPEVGKWVTPTQLHEMNSTIPVIYIQQTLQLLVRAGLLVRRAVDGKYGFGVPAIAEEVLRLAGPEVERMSRAENEVERVWLSWLARSAFASGEQLRYLESFRYDLTPRALKTMLLLRSAVERQQSPSAWLNLLNRHDGRALMFQLEGLPRPDGVPVDSKLDLRKAEKLLELPVAGQSPNGQYTSVGRVSQNAVSHSDPAVRQACALAVTAISDDKTVGVGRLTAALSARGNPLRVRAELRGALADADPQIEALNRSLSPWDRTAIWAWRALRRIAQDRHRWLVLMLGGAIGAGLGLGLMRGVIAAVANDKPGIQFGMYFYYGFILGCSLALGMSLAKPLLLREHAQAERAEVASDPSLSTLTSSLAVVLGAIFFGFGHILSVVINGLSPWESPLVVPMGFIGGLGLSLSISLFHRIRSRFAAWLVALVCAIAVWALVQIPFNFSTLQGDALSIVNTGWYYESRFNSHSWWPQLENRLPNLINLFSTFDSALAGACLTGGMSIGLTWARKYINRRHQKNSTME